MVFRKKLGYLIFNCNNCNCNSESLIFPTEPLATYCHNKRKPISCFMSRKVPKHKQNVYVFLRITILYVTFAEENIAN